MCGRQRQWPALCLLCVRFPASWQLALCDDLPVTGLPSNNPDQYRSSLHGDFIVRNPRKHVSATIADHVFHAQSAESSPPASARCCDGYPDNCVTTKPKVVKALLKFTLTYFVNLFRELHLGQEFLEAGIGVDGIEAGILTEPVHATSALVRLVQPLKSPILVPQLRINAGDFVGTNVLAQPAVPGRRRALVLRNFP
jgi:hypothetical protein